MTGKAAAATVTVIAGILMLSSAGTALLAGTPGCALPLAVGTPGTAGSGRPAVGGYDREQVAMVATIVAVGAQLHVPQRGWVIAVATALQKSRLRNLPGGDHDSVGVFQQRPSQGWGHPAQLADPVYASQRFFTTLLTVTGWQQLPLTDAAQAVQRSAHPGAYARWESDATMLVDAVAAGADGTARGPSVLPSDCDDAGGDGARDTSTVPLPAGWTLAPDIPPTVAVAIAWALAQRGTPYQFGGDCADPHGAIAVHHCDCSSLVQAAYRAAGINIPRVTTDQMHAGIAVAGLAQIRPGDLLFIPGSLGTPQQPRHVGMYLGDGLLVQAPHTGDVVRISTLVVWREQVSIIRRIVA
ncbi:C40 family peptidase [Actinoplanes sp. CA-030573]|uniref:C40 family peptidase n=1 Tax=Actinoplanes sp. CA-030573 TaxID=3239898 RepID=UPI003D92D3E5